ncbi:MAG: metal-dependent hydrolase [Candidatus Heimdallarchaeota archaeon]|nr:MAG: metal-dependent hydrolase [Candidatus Heimdallarchaeota archaeon]
MKNSTHYLFAVGLLNLYVLIFIRDPLLAWVFFILSFPLSGVSLLPNLLDSYTAADLKFEGVQLHRVRHPLTHSPWTLGYFLPLYYIGEQFSNQFFIFMVFVLVLGWLSHLLLDTLNPEGIPLGKQPIFLPHPVKHYSFQRKRTNTRVLRLARIPFNDLKRNATFSRCGLLFLALNMADLIYNHLQVITEVIFFV